MATSTDALKAQIARLRNRSYNSATNPTFAPEVSVDRLQDAIFAAVDELAATMWDEGYAKGNLDGYFGTRQEKNPYRAEVSA